MSVSEKGLGHLALEDGKGSPPAPNTPGPCCRPTVRLRDPGLTRTGLLAGHWLLLLELSLAQPTAGRQVSQSTSHLAWPAALPSQNPKDSSLQPGTRGCFGLTYLLAVFAGAAVSFSNSSFSEKITTLSVGK